MDNQNQVDKKLDTTDAATDTAQKARDRKRAATQQNAKTATKSKKDQLVALLSKPNGARVSLLVERLGWQAHTVRAALSGLRKQGFEISTSKSAKTGETVYAITGQSASNNDTEAGAAA